MPRRSNSKKKFDRILDKIRKSGYDSLTKDEKQKLFDSSKKLSRWSIDKEMSC